MNQDLLRTQKELSELIGCPGREHPVREYLKSRLEGTADSIEVDGAGNLIAAVSRVAGPDRSSEESRRGARILVTAHMDEVGFMVSHVEESGFLRVVTLGSIDTLLLSGTPVQFITAGGDAAEGVFTSVPPHVKKKNEAPAVPALEDLAVDLGLRSRERVEEMGLTVGSVGTFLTPFRSFGDGALSGKAFDNRSGCNIALQTALRWKRSPDRPGGGQDEADPQPGAAGMGPQASQTLVCLFTTAEEHNHGGARAAALSQQADVIVALENTTTTDTPGVPEQQVITRLGGGPALTVADKSHIVPEELLRFIQQTAARHGIPWQFKKPVYGGTDAGSLAVAGGGTPACLISVPCRYLHAPVGVTLGTDLERTAELVYRVCSEYPGDPGPG